MVFALSEHYMEGFTETEMTGCVLRFPGNTGALLQLFNELPLTDIR